MIAKKCQNIKTILNLKNAEDLLNFKKTLTDKSGNLPRNSEIISIIRSYYQQANAEQKLKLEKLEHQLKKSRIRTLSGIAPIAVMTKPYPCPGNCLYCPTQKNAPTSYLSNEPAVMRAILCNYDPYLQTVLRLRALEKNGHQPEKIELIVMGGTWSALPKSYRYAFIYQCFKAVNDYHKKLKKIIDQDHDFLATKNIAAIKKINLKPRQSYQQALLIEQKKNETSKYRIIGLTLETRPDYLNVPEIKMMRAFGCTRVEMGVQAVDDKILKQNRRGHNLEEITRATKLLKQYGFKVTYHFMPGLYGSTPKKDLAMYQTIYHASRFQPDQIKFYPTVVVKGSALYNFWKQKKYRPYSNSQLEQLIMDCKNYTPEYTRIIRLIRDIPEESIEAGNKITNLRQLMQERGVKCRCIRCREPKGQLMLKSPKLMKREYLASDGKEYFISFESKDEKIIYGFCRLRIDQNSPIAPAIIRELHVYGELVPVGNKTKKIQHTGLGKKLMQIAEDIANKNHCQTVAVISGIGAKNYYRKLGYHLRDTYMIKSLTLSGIRTKTA